MLWYCIELGVYSRNAGKLAAILRAYEVNFKTTLYENHKDVFCGNIGTASMTWFSIQVYSRRGYEQLIDVLDKSNMDIAIQG